MKLTDLPGTPRGLVQAFTLACRIFGIFPDPALPPAPWRNGLVTTGVGSSLVARER